MLPHQKIENKLEALHLEAGDYILELRGEDKMDWGIEYNTFGLEVGNMMLSLQDMMWILEYGITKDIVYERWGMVSMEYYSDRVHAMIDSDSKYRNTNLISFWSMFGGEKADKQREEDLKKSEENVEKARKELEKAIDEFTKNATKDRIKNMLKKS